MIPRTAAEISAAVAGQILSGEPGTRVSGVSIDTRTIAVGDLFFAIRGERHDGHDFVNAALAAGAAAAVVDRPIPVPPGVLVILVEDTTLALGRLAADERRRRSLRLVAITGSAGKTTTRALTAAALGVRWKTAGSEGNLNNHWGLPLSILRLAPESEAAVLELGMNHRGEIAALTAIARPDIGLITNIGTAHIGLLGSREEIAAAKAELLQGLPPGGSGVVPGDAPELDPLLAGLRCPLLRFGFSERSDFRPMAVEGDLLRGARFLLEGIPVQLALWGRHAVLNATAALAAAQALGLSIAEAAPALAGISNPAGRGRILRLAGAVTVVDEVYNANPSAMATVLGELVRTPWAGRRVAVLGEMRELGGFALEFHRELGRKAVQSGITKLVAVGAMAAEIAAGAQAAGLQQVDQFPDADAAAADVPHRIQDGDLVLIKGSRGVELEKVREALLAVRAEEGGR